MISVIETAAPEEAKINEKIKLHKRIHFLICDSCFWCASCIGDSVFFECPTCPYFGKVNTSFL
jgi:hypothetical protein